jgi:hypothetical protein
MQDDPIGIGLWVYPSYFNHSCNYNCFWMNRGDVLMIRTIKRIKTGEELTIPYVAYAPLAERMDGLKSKDFVCNCKDCIDEKPDLILGDIKLLREKCYELMKRSASSISEWERMLQVGQRYKHGDIRWLCAFHLIIFGNMDIKTKYSKYILGDDQISTYCLKHLVVLAKKMMDAHAPELAVKFYDKMNHMYKILFGDAPIFRKSQFTQYSN